MNTPLLFGTKTAKTNKEIKQDKDTAIIKYVKGRPQPDEYLLQLIGKYLKSNKGKTVLEIGCNNGNNLLPLSGIYKAYGVDLDTENKLIPALLKEAATQGKNVNIARWNITNDPPLPTAWKKSKGLFLKTKNKDLKGKCDAIFAVHVFSHLSDNDLIKTVHNLKEYLVPGGVFISTIIDPESSNFGEFSPSNISQDEKFFNNIQGQAKNGTSKISDVQGGFKAHDAGTVQDAFSGLGLIHKDSRHFKLGEINGWALPESRIRWLVYKKPSHA